MFNILNGFCGIIALGNNLNVFTHTNSKTQKGDGMQILVRQVRLSKKMSIRTLAEKSGVSIGQISNIERGSSIPTILVLCKLANAMGVQVTSLFECQ